MSTLKEAVQATFGRERVSLKGYFNYLASDKEANDNEVKVSRKSENTKPSSSTSPGMEDRNHNYGKGTTDNTEMSGGAQTGQVVESHSGANHTSEGSGMPDLSIDHHKTAAIKHKLAVINLKQKLTNC
jgi:hypothetical protein